MNRILWVLILFASFTVLGDESCERCALKSSAISSANKNIQQIARTHVEEDCQEGQICTDLLFRNVHYSDLRPSCKGFWINEDGTRGEWAQYVMELLNERTDLPYFDSNNGIAAVCPGFTKFSLEMKKYFWVHFFKTLAFHEASCRPALTNRNSPNPPAVGLYQLDGNARIRKSRYKYVKKVIANVNLEEKEDVREGRNAKEKREIAMRTAARAVPGWGEGCHPEKILGGWKPNILCAMQMFDVQIQVDGAFGRHVYWAPLRQYRRVTGVQRAFRNNLDDFPGCL